MNYFLIFIIALLINFSTLYMVARKSKDKIKHMFSNPAFLLGDFFIIPIYFTLISYLLNINWIASISIVESTSFLIIIISSIILTLIFLKKNNNLKNLMKPIWIPHGVFIWVVLCSLLLAVFTSYLNGWKDLFLLIFIILLLIFHQLLGVFFPKKLS